jgi:GNAT superfamily N-acetyltransferase
MAERRRIDQDCDVPGRCESRRTDDPAGVGLHSTALDVSGRFPSGMSNYLIRRATVRDAAVIAAHRVAMFNDMGHIRTADLADRLLTASTAALSEVLRDGTYVGWLAVDADRRVIAGAGAHFKPQLPRISHGGRHVSAGPVPLVVNVYTDPQWRRRGVARALMKELMEWAMACGYDRVVLHASDAGKSLYESLGFMPTNEMRWTSPGDPDAS